jgi:hypothetical protein
MTVKLRAASTLMCLLVIATLAACADPKEEFAKADAQGTRSAFEQFAKQFPKDPLAEIAKQQVEQLALDATVQARSLDECKRFLADFPGGRHRAQVMGLMEEIAFEEASKENRVDEWKAMLRDYPNGAYRRRVSRKLQELWTDQGSPRTYNIAVEAPNNTHMERAPNGSLISIPPGTKLTIDLSWSDKKTEPSVHMAADFVRFYPPVAYFKDSNGRWLAYAFDNILLLPIPAHADLLGDPTAIADRNEQMIVAWRMNADATGATLFETSRDQVIAEPELVGLLGAMATPETRVLLESLAKDSSTKLATAAQSALKTWHEVDEFINRQPRVDAAKQISKAK